MIAALVLGLGVWGAMPVVHAAALAVLWQEPTIVAPVLGVATGKVLLAQKREHRSERLAGWLRTTAAELRAGMSLRSALSAAANSYPGLGLARVSRLAGAGRPISEISQELAVVPGLEAVAVVLEVTSITGGSVAPILESLAVEAADEAGLAAERRSLTVAARWSIGLVGGFPLLLLTTQLVRGEIGRMLDGGVVSAVLVLVGVVLLVSGLAIVGLLMHRART
jgi:Flp pilus assembly protein TadB